jgi:hypothetical protein
MRWGSLVVVLASLLLATGASAKTSREYPYEYGSVWPSLVRFLRVDENLKLVEKDEANGYILFELTDGKRTFAGAAEVVRVEKATRVILRLTDRPAYMEAGLLERFGGKLHDELGEPQHGKDDAKDAKDSQDRKEPSAP